MSVPSATGPARGRGARRVLVGLGAAALGLAGLTALLLALAPGLPLASVVLLYLVVVVTAAVVGGLPVALLAAVASDLVVNYFFVPPRHTLSVERGDQVIALVVYVAVAATVSVAVDLAARQRAAAARTRVEAAWLARVGAAQATRVRELAEVDRQRAALLAAVGHDLRTPLASIKLGTSSLRDPELPLDPDQRAELLATIDESADHMADLVENLLAMSRLRAGALSVHLRPTALDEVVAAALLHQPSGRPVTLDVPDDLPLALADPGLLERVVANLLSNADHASPPGRPVEVHGRAVADRRLLSIVDHGPGVPPADRDRLFGPFQRLDDRTPGGLGLGLAIARGFTEAMSGTVTATDTPGGGLTMTLDLPGAP